MKAPSNSAAAKGTQSKHLHARIAFLHKASVYMAQQSLPPRSYADRHISEDSTPAPPHDEKEAFSSSSVAADASPAVASLQSRGLPNHLATQLRGVSRKAQLRLSHDIKRSLCKVCNAPLIPGRTSQTYMLNRSKQGSKACADVRVVSCLSCGVEKRFPTGAPRQKRKSAREQNISHSPSGVAAD